MKELKHLPQIAERQLGGLKADTQLLARIKLNAAPQEQRSYHSSFRWQTALAVCAALVLCITGVLWATEPSDGGVVVVQETPVINSHSAGTVEVTKAPPAIGDLPGGSITMSGSGSRGSESLFASGQGNSIPLITVNGATYQMLSYPDGISSALLGKELGLVNEYNLEPALGSGDIISNIAAPGVPVYAIDGMKGAMIAAKVDGSLRVFQRISYAGTAVIGKEDLSDTLCSASKVEWIRYNGNTVSGGKAQQLMETLLNDASFQSTGMSGSGSLQIGLTNGLALQLLVGDDTISACGTWSCPDFFEAFADAVN